jgi:hypothetical protein
MELYNFINNNNINNFESLKSVLESELFNLKIKEDIEYPSLFLIHTLDNSIFSNKIVNECNGIILDKNTLKIVCYTFNTCTLKVKVHKSKYTYIFIFIIFTIQDLYIYKLSTLLYYKRLHHVNCSLDTNKKVMLYI